MPDVMLTAFAAQGVLGLSTFALARACWQLQQQVKAVQDERVADAKAVTETVLRLVTEQHAANMEITGALVELRNRLEE